MGGVKEKRKSPGIQLAKTPRTIYTWRGVKLFQFKTAEDKNTQVGFIARDGSYRKTIPPSGNTIHGSILDQSQKEPANWEDFPNISEQFTYCPPISHPSKIIGVAGNFSPGQTSLGFKNSISSLQLFSKSPSSLASPNSTLEISPEQLVDFEAELALIIGRDICNVSIEEAAHAILGYTIANDISDRALQGDGRAFFRAKSRDGYCPLGPFLVPPEELDFNVDLKICSYLNGELMQSASASEMTYSPAEIVQYISRSTRLLPGDIILLGAPPGYGMHQVPPRFLKSADKVRIEITGLGQQHLSIRAPKD